MAYKKRKRADKYEEKLRIDGTFEDAMKALLGVHPKQQNMKQFKLDLENSSFPIVDGSLSSDNYTKMKITGKTNVGFNIIFWQGNGNTYPEMILPEFETGIFNKELILRFIPCQMKFELNTKMASKEPPYADVSLEFSN